MTNKRNNESGFTFISVIALLLITMSFSSMLITSTRHFNKHQYNIRETRNIKETASNKVLELYVTRNWRDMPSKEEIVTNTGVVDIEYDHSLVVIKSDIENEEDKIYEKLNVLFSHNGKQRDYVLKRGVQ